MKSGVDSLTQTECSNFGFFHNDHSFNADDFENVFRYSLGRYNYAKLDIRDNALIFICPISNGKHQCDHYIDALSLLKEYCWDYDLYSKLENLALAKKMDIMRIKYDRVAFCPLSHCQGSKGFITNEKLSTIKNWEYPIVDCTFCKQVWCAKCFKPIHEGSCFGKGKSTNKYFDYIAEDNMKYIINNTIICPNCSNGVEKIDGCDHISCPCGTEICWVCGEDVTDNLYEHVGEETDYRCINTLKYDDDCKISDPELRECSVIESRKEIFKKFFEDEYLTDNDFNKVRDYDEEEIIYN